MVAAAILIDYKHKLYYSPLDFICAPPSRCYLGNVGMYNRAINAFNVPDPARIQTLSAYGTSTRT
jgi:hypothetical protein